MPLKYWQCEDCDSTYMYVHTLGYCDYCGSTKMHEMDLEDFDRNLDDLDRDGSH